MWQKSQLMFVMLVGCAGGAKYPEGSTKVYCTNLVDDCNQQVADECPAGYKVLETQNWTTNLGSTARGGSRPPAVRHRSVRILCESETPAGPPAKSAD